MPATYEASDAAQSDVHSTDRVELLTASPLIARFAKEESHEIGATKALTHADENWSAPGPSVVLGKKKFCAAILPANNDSKPIARARLVASDILARTANEKEGR